MNTTAPQNSTETLHGTAVRRILVQDVGGAAYWLEAGEPVEVRESRTSGKYLIYSPRLVSQTLRMSLNDMLARVDPT